MVYEDDLKFLKENENGRTFLLIKKKEYTISSNNV